MPLSVCYFSSPLCQKAQNKHGNKFAIHFYVSREPPSRCWALIAWLMWVYEDEYVEIGAKGKRFSAPQISTPTNCWLCIIPFGCLCVRKTNGQFCQRMWKSLCNEVDVQNSECKWESEMVLTSVNTHMQWERNMCVVVEGMLISGLGQIWAPMGRVLPYSVKLLSLL